MSITFPSKFLEYTLNPSACDIKNFINDYPKIEDEIGTYLDPAVFDIFSKFYVKCDAPSGATVYKLSYSLDGRPRAPEKIKYTDFKRDFRFKVPTYAGDFYDDEEYTYRVKKREFKTEWETAPTTIVYDEIVSDPHKAFGYHMVYYGKSKSHTFNIYVPN